MFQPQPPCPACNKPVRGALRSSTAPVYVMLLPCGHRSDLAPRGDVEAYERIFMELVTLG